VKAPDAGRRSVNGRGAHLRRTSQADQKRDVGGIGPDLELEGSVNPWTAPQVNRVPQWAVGGVGDDRGDGEVQART
jgi:hypothetical protein